MRLIDLFAAAASALTGNKIRTALTLLGIVVGTACVVSMVAVGEGAKMRIARQIQAFGANVVLISPAQSQRDGVSKERQQTLTEADAEAIGQLPTIARAAGSVFGSVQVVAGDHNQATTVNGTTSGQFAIRAWPLKSGRLFTAEEEAYGDKVAILGRTVAAKLFPGGEPLDRIVRLSGAPFTVIGVLGPKGAAANGDDQDDVVFVPLTAARIRLIGGAQTVNYDAVGHILASATSARDMDAAIEDIEDLLRQRHHTPPGAEDFVVTSAASLLAAQKSSARTVALLLGAIAAISLVVGGISITNIMLVSASERTKEIGLRMAVGARPRDVRRQFLCEALALGFVGGGLGAVVGLGGALAIGRSLGWPVEIDGIMAAAAVALATLLGGTFGWYPANRAARMLPVVALRT